MLTHLHKLPVVFFALGRLIVKPLKMGELARNLRDYLSVRKDMPGVGCAGAVWVQTDPERVQLRLDDTRHFGAIQVFGPP